MRLNTEHYVRNPLHFFVNTFALILANTHEPFLLFARYIYEGSSLCTENIRTLSTLSWLYIKPFKTFSTLHWPKLRTFPTLYWPYLRTFPTLYWWYLVYSMLVILFPSLYLQWRRGTFSTLKGVFKNHLFSALASHSKNLPFYISAIFKNLSFSVLAISMNLPYSVLAISKNLP